MLERHGLGEKVADWNRLAATIAAEAAGPDGWVIGDVGPFGDFLEPMGDTTVEELEAIFREQITALVEGGADAILVETMSDPGELVRRHPRRETSHRSAGDRHLCLPEKRGRIPHHDGNHRRGCHPGRLRCRRLDRRCELRDRSIVGRLSRTRPTNRRRRGRPAHHPPTECRRAENDRR